MKMSAVLKAGLGDILTVEGEQLKVISAPKEVVWQGKRIARLSAMGSFGKTVVLDHNDVELIHKNPGALC
jgi:hypothetical protein